MASTDINNWSTAQSIVSNAGTTPAPSDSTDQWYTSDKDVITAFITVPGGVTSADIQIWVWDDTAWYKGAVTTVEGTNGNVALDWTVGSSRRFTFSITSYSGSGTITVKALGTNQ